MNRFFFATSAVGVALLLVSVATAATETNSYRRLVQRAAAANKVTPKAIAEAVRSASLKKHAQRAKELLALQQRNGGFRPQSSEGECDFINFLVWINSYSDACENQLDALGDLLDPSKPTARRDLACSNGCNTRYRDGLRDHGACFGEDLPAIKAGIEIWIIGCERHDGEYCAEKFLAGNAMDDCETISRTTCESHSHCQWDYSDGTCLPAPTNAILGKMCHSCPLRLIKTVALSSNGTSGRLLLQAWNQVICNKVDGQFCYSRLARDIVGNSSFTGSATSLEQGQATARSVCGDSTNRACFKSMMTAFLSMEFEERKDTYDRCMRSYSTESGRRQWCYPYLDAIVRQKKGDANRYASACAQNAAGTYCIAYAGALVEVNTTNPTCVTQLPSCSATCNSAYNTVASTMGCCGAAVSEVITGGNTNYVRADLPSSAANMEIVSYAMDTDSQWVRHHMYTYRNCELATSNSNYKGVSMAGCTDANVIAKTNPNPTLQLGLNVYWSSIANDALLQERLKTSLTLDCASSLNLFPHQVKNAVLAEQPKITIDGSRRRRQTIRSGVLFSFEVDGQDDTENDAAVASWKSNVQSGKFEPAAAAILLAEECSGCTPQGQTTLVDQSTTSGGASGATSVTAALLLSVVAIGALLC